MTESLLDITTQDLGDRVAVTVVVTIEFAESIGLGGKAFIGGLIIDAARKLAAQHQAKTAQELDTERIAEAMAEAKATPGQVVTIETDG
jgi:hypothetical protein